MEVSHDDPIGTWTVSAATRAIGDAGVIDAVRALADDRVAIASVPGPRKTHTRQRTAMTSHAIFTGDDHVGAGGRRACVRSPCRATGQGDDTGCRASRRSSSLKWNGRSVPFFRGGNEWAAAAAPLLEEFDRMAAVAAEAMERLRPALKQFHERKQTHDALDKVGWLPHPSVPYRLVEGCGDDLALLDARVAEYYRTRWTEIRDEMESGLAEYHMTMKRGRRSGRRTLSPRVWTVPGYLPLVVPRNRADHRSAGDRQDADDRETACIGRSDRIVQVRELFDRVMLERHSRGTPTSRYGPRANGRGFERDPVPNRHAAIHGRVAYSTHKHSMNMLILTDYVFRILPPLEDSTRSWRSEPHGLVAVDRAHRRRRFSFLTPDCLAVRASSRRA